ncbi:MAG: septum formation inhibitor Maf [Verrucomicrobiota bacterium]
MNSLLSTLRHSGVAFVAGFTVSCASPFPETSAKSIEDYWFDKAEITRYDLEQLRYGEIRSGESVLIFVTEPFLSEQQVKHEYGPGDDAVPVLKLNRLRSFKTGIYPYEMMTSIFQPVHETGPAPSGLKIATSTTEWCGLVFQQVNRRSDALEVEVRSYFQREADQDVSLPEAWTEDELWTRLRLDPQSLPTGEFSLFPETFFQRLAHLQPVLVEASAELDFSDATASYTINTPSLARTISISFESDFPHRILGWEETVNGQLFSKGTATHSEMLYYWENNAIKDEPLRQKLGFDR